MTPRALVLIIAIAFLLFGASVVLGHEWYPPSCCKGTASNGDCMPIPEGGVAEMATGFKVKTTDPIWGTVDEVVPLADVQPSHDGQYHMCLKAPGYPVRIRCFFAPLGY